MKQTQADKKAARDGFRYVVIRHGERIAYTTTLGEAKRECGKSGKVVAISGMTYAAKNPRKRRNPDNRAGWYADDRPSAADRKEIGNRIDAVIREIPKHPKANIQLMGYLPQILRDLKYSYNDGGVTRSYVSKVLLDAMQEIRRAEGESIPRRNPISSHGGEMSRSKAEAAYARADRAYTKAVEAYGGFDDRTVAAYRRRQKAEQVLHAILRRNPDAGEGQAEPSVLAALGYKIGKYTRKGIRGTKSFVSKAREGWQAGKQNPKYRDSRGVEHDFSNDVYPKSLFPWGVSYKKKLPAAYGEPSIVVDGQLSFMTEADAHQWATSPRVAKSGYFGTRVFQRNPRKRRKR